MSLSFLACAFCFFFRNNQENEIFQSEYITSGPLVQTGTPKNQTLIVYFESKLGSYKCTGSKRSGRFVIFINIQI
jgi:hypothetical protein